MQRVQVWSLIRELRSHMPHRGSAKTFFKKSISLDLSGVYWIRISLEEAPIICMSLRRFLHSFLCFLKWGESGVIPSKGSLWRLTEGIHRARNTVYSINVSYFITEALVWTKRNIEDFRLGGRTGKTWAMVMASLFKCQLRTVTNKLQVTQGRPCKPHRGFALPIITSHIDFMLNCLPS